MWFWMLCDCIKCTSMFNGRRIAKKNEINIFSLNFMWQKHYLQFLLWSDSDALLYIHYSHQTSNYYSFLGSLTCWKMGFLDFCNVFETLLKSFSQNKPNSGKNYIFSGRFVPLPNGSVREFTHSFCLMDCLVVFYYSFLDVLNIARCCSSAQWN